MYRIGLPPVKYHHGEGSAVIGQNAIGPLLRARGAMMVIVLYALLAVLVVPIFPHFLSPNEFSRWIVDAAIVEDHTVAVTAMNARFQGAIQDLAEFRGRLYSNKAPGVTLAGLPAYALARAVLGPPRPDTIRGTLTAMRLLASTLPLLLLAWMMLRAGRFFGAAEEQLRWVPVILLFATPLGAYGMLLFSHAVTAFALFGAWVLLFTGTFGRRPALSGALMGLAVLSEYPAALVVIIFLICAAVQSRRDLVRIVLGGAPFLVALLLYNQIAFGSPFAVSYIYTEHAAYQGLARSGIFGLHLPQIGILASLLFDPSRGLLVLSPVLLCALGATEARARLGPAAFWSCVAAPLALIILYAGYPYWHGGWGIGARYLVPALPFIVFFLSFAEMSFGAAVLAGMSVMAVMLVTLVFPFVPPNAFPLPRGSLAWPILRDGLVAPNLLHFIDRPIAVVVPFAIVFAAVAIGVPVRNWIAFAAGAITMIGLGIAYNATTTAWIMPRAYFERVYFDQPGALTRSLPRGVPVAPRIEKHMHNELQSPPPGWPF